MDPSKLADTRALGQRTSRSSDSLPPLWLPPPSWPPASFFSLATAFGGEEEDVEEEEGEDDDEEEDDDEAFSASFSAGEERGGDVTGFGAMTSTQSTFTATRFSPVPPAPDSIRTRAMACEFQLCTTALPSPLDADDDDDDDDEEEEEEEEEEEPLAAQMCTMVPVMLCAGSHPLGRHRDREQWLFHALLRGGLMCRSGSL